MTYMNFNHIEEAIEDIKNGKMVIVVDDENRENEGDLVMAADKVTPEAINFMAAYGRGLICTPITPEKADKLGLNVMTSRNTDPKGTAFTVSIDHKSCSTGISAYERCETIKAISQQFITEAAFTKPGHIFPLIAKKGGVLERDGHTEAAVDLAQLAGCEPVGVICEILKEDGHMARVPDLFPFAKEHNLKIVTIEDLIRYQSQRKQPIIKVETSNLPTKHGEFTMVGYENPIDGKSHVALVMGEVKDGEDVLIRMHSECLTGDAFGSLRCDCGQQLDEALGRIVKEGRGVLLYLRQEGRGIGLMNKIKAYALQDRGLDTVDANTALGLPEDARSYDIGAWMLRDLGIRSVRVMTNNPDKLKGLEEIGIHITGREAIEMNHHEKSAYYLKTKKERMGHLLNIK